MSNVSSNIGEKYKEWNYYNTIFITAPTGTGKTYFILHDLLEYLIDNANPISQNMGYEKILYLVNRKILAEQLNEELKNEIGRLLHGKLQVLQADIDDFIEIMTYQKIEKELKSTYSANSNVLYHLMNTPYKYIIYDECHYFSVDSTYNTFTELSYDFLRNTFYNKIQIFLSATMENIRGILENRKECFSNANENMFSQFRDANMFIHPYHYTLQADYSNVTIRVIKDKTILKNLILNNQRRKDEKWLIFTDNINQGRQLKEELSSCINNEDKDSIVFIDAQYKQEESSYEIVNQIASNKCCSAKILIATSVMDNGISIEDIQLRNVVIMADTKETFLQMLGRKRYASGEKDNITVYIMKRDIKHFTNRYESYNKILSFYEKHKNKLKNNLNGMAHFIPEEYQNNLIKQPYTLNLYRNLYGFSNTYNIERQQEPLEDVLEDSKTAKILAYPYRGKYNFNSFSVDRCKYLKGFYYNIKEELQKDDNYFIKLQYSWLGKTVDNQEIEYAFEEEIKIHKENVIKDIEKKIGKKLNKDENIELKNSIKDDTKYLLEISNYDKENLNSYIQCFSDSNRSISESMFNDIMEIVELDYRMSKPDRSTFIINKLEDEN